MAKKTTLSIGIPAFNEQDNIASLLKNILDQESHFYKLEKIYVFSDGSNDDTVNQIKKVQDSRIIIKQGRLQRGKSYRMNEISEVATSDVLVFLDADIFISDTQFFDKLFVRLPKQDAIISVNTTPLPGRTFVENAINHGVNTIQKTIRKSWKEGKNYLAFNGRCIVLTKNIYKDLILSTSLVNQDAYMYFYAVSKNFKTKYYASLVVYYRSPSTLKEYLQQSVRAKMSYKELSDYFQPSILHYSIPKTLIFIAFFQSVLNNPLYFFGYIGLYLISVIKPFTPENSSWDPIASTKKIFAST